MPTSIILSDSETDLSHAVDLMSVTGSDGMFVRASGFKAPPPGPNDATRTITINLAIRGSSAQALHEHRRDVERLLRMAPRATGAPQGAWTGNPIILRVKELNSPNYVSFDVLDGSLDAEQRDFGSSNVQTWTLTLTCLPLARGAAVLMQDWTSTLVNGNNATVFLQGVPGDADALCTVELKDASTPAVAAINGMYVGMRAHRYQASGDYSPVLAATAIGAASTNSSPAVLFGSEAQITTSASWQDLCTIAPPSLPLLNYGMVRLLIHCRTSASILGTPQGLTGTPALTGGSLTEGSWGFMVTEVDGSGTETTLSNPAYVVIPTGITAASIALSWTKIGSPSNHRLYVRQPGSYTWLSKLTASTSASYSFTATTGLATHTPPSTTGPALIPPEFRVRTALYATSPVWSPPGQPFVPVIGGSLYEYGDGGVWPLPPLLRQEGQADQRWIAKVEVRSQGTATPTVAVDGAWCLPYGEGEYTTYFSLPGKANTTLRRYVIDSRRDGRMSGLITGTPVFTNIDTIQPHGWFAIPVGNVRLIFAGESIGGEANTTDLAYQVKVTVRPRYRDVIGLVT